MISSHKPYKLIHLGEIDSTQYAARGIIAAGESTQRPIVIHADTQTAGVGSRGRRFASPLGGLWITVLMRAQPNDPATLARAVGNAIASACPPLPPPHPPLTYREPNDLILKTSPDTYHKVGGCLIESFTARKANWLAVGIGINANNPSANIEAEHHELAGEPLRAPAASLRELLGRPVTLDRLRDAVALATIAAVNESAHTPTH